MGVHVVVMPFPAAGHSTPFVIFAKCLAKLGVAVTFIAPQTTLSRFNDTKDDDDAAARRNINLVPFDLAVDEGVDSEKLETVKFWMRNNAEMFSDMVGRLMTTESQAVHSKHSSVDASGPPLCIVSDMFSGFTQVRLCRLIVSALHQFQCV